MFPSFSKIRSDTKHGLSGVWFSTVWRELVMLLIKGVVPISICILELAFAVGLILYSSTSRTGLMYQNEPVTSEQLTLVCSLLFAHAIISLVRNALASGMKVGMSKYYLELASSPNTKPNSGLTSHTKYYINQFTLYAIKDIYTVLLSFFCVIPGIIARAKWSMSHFIIAEDHETRASEALIESGYVMEGFKLKYVLFNMSLFPAYIPLIIFGSLTAVATIWLQSEVLILTFMILTLGAFIITTPYIKAAQAKFYYYIKNPIIDAESELKELKTLKAEKFSFDDFVVEYEAKVAKRMKNPTKNDPNKPNYL